MTSKGAEFRPSLPYPSWRSRLSAGRNRRFRIQGEEEGQKREAGAGGDGERLMHQGAGEHHGPAARRLVALLSILRKDQLAALIFIAVEIERHGEHAIAGAGTLAVAMAPEIVAAPGVVTGD